MGCNLKIKRRKFLDHKDNLCDFTLKSCIHCVDSTLFKRTDLKKHMISCKYRPIECPNHCGPMLSSHQLDSHISTDCPLELITCPLAELGNCSLNCPKLEKRKIILEHVTKPSHLLQLVVDLSTKCNKMQTDISLLTQINQQLHTKLNKHANNPVDYQMLVNLIKDRENDRDNVVTSSQSKIAFLSDNVIKVANVVERKISGDENISQTNAFKQLRSVISPISTSVEVQKYTEKATTTSPPISDYSPNLNSTTEKLTATQKKNRAKKAARKTPAASNVEIELLNEHLDSFAVLSSFANTGTTATTARLPSPPRQTQKGLPGTADVNTDMSGEETCFEYPPLYPKVFQFSLHN